MTIAEIAGLIHAERRKRGWTQAELGRRAGISRQLVSEFESGNIEEIGIRKVDRMCFALKLELGVSPIDCKASMRDMEGFIESKSGEEIGELLEMGRVGKLEYHRRRQTLKN